MKIVSKDEGPRSLLPLMGTQQYMLDEILDGLANDVHVFIVDKARQLGSTSICLALGLFWCGLYAPLQGGIVADTEANKEETIRARIDEMIAGLEQSNYPLGLRKGRSGHNKTGIHFDSGSVLQYLVAGTKKGGSALGQSRSLNFILATEVASYGDPEQLEKLKAALSDRHPNRLYIFESTPNHYNLFYDMWEDAQHDPTQRAIFVGWWRNEGYRYERDDPLFRQYGVNSLTPEEKDVTDEVARRWGFHIEIEQWAWYRHHRNPQGGSEVATERFERFLAEYPSTPEEGFRSSGSPFMNPRVIGKLEEEAILKKFLPRRYEVGEDYRAMRYVESRSGRYYDLKIWEEPVAGASYVISADPAYASSDESDSYCIEVGRCYADRIEQVAEFHRRNMEPYQFTWAVAHLCGLYVNVRLIFDINGPGEAVKGEFRNMRTLAANGLLSGFAGNEENNDFLAKVKTYLYHRPDSLGAGYAIEWKTSEMNRTPILIGLADQMAIGQCTVCSMAAFDEIRRLRQKGSVIFTEGRAHDDRVMALAMMVRAWQDWERSPLRAAGRTWEAEHTDPSKPVGDPVAIYLTAQINADRERKAASARMVAGRRRAAVRAGHWNW